jgi:hypothetical protein
MLQLQHYGFNNQNTTLIMISSKKGSIELAKAIMMAICEPVIDKSAMDLMCHKAPITSRMGFKKIQYLDILDRDVDSSVNKEDVIIDDVLTHIFKEHYDVAFCLDGIEHLTYQDGLKLLDTMKVIADINIIFTPLGELETNPYDAHPDSHKFGWLPEHFKGWNTVIFPRWHHTLNTGAFFAWRGIDNSDKLNPFI